MDITEELENLESELDLDTIIETFPFERVHELMVKSDGDGILLMALEYLQ